MNTIAGLEDVSSGQLLLEGQDMTHRSPKDRDIAMVFQSYALYPTMNVARNISFDLKCVVCPRRRERKVDEVSGLLQSTTYSIGSRQLGWTGQRVAMGALARSPGLSIRRATLKS